MKRQFVVLAVVGAVAIDGVHGPHTPGVVPRRRCAGPDGGSPCSTP